MQHWPRIVTLWLLWILLLGACQSTQTPSATTPAADVDQPVTPTVPAELVFAEDARVAGIDIAGMTVAEASAHLQEELAARDRAVRLQAGDTQSTIFLPARELETEITGLLDEAQEQAMQDAPVEVPRDLALEETMLPDQLDRLADEISSTTTLELITATDTLTRSFAYRPGRSLDVAAALAQIATELQSPDASAIITLDLEEDPNVPRPTFAQLQEQVNIIADEWNGVVGFYLQDLATGETVTRNPDTVFSGASLLKVPILLFAYTRIPEFDEEEERWKREMVIESNNLSANDLLAAAVEGTGTDMAYAGSKEMNVMLRELGFQHTYQNMPYEAGDYLIGLRGLAIEYGPAQEGSPPYTEADPIVRTTPAEISRIFVMINECSQGEGQLLEQFTATLTAEDCQAILDLLAQNADKSRIAAGLPEGTRFEHKSGWTGDMHADVGIVRSEGGDFLLATYIYQEQNNSYLPDFRAARYISALSRLVYTAYNPEKVE
jgi:beta-lactamase class A